jgi:glycosyltransferase involved in cell wall biosynthesis
VRQSQRLSPAGALLRLRYAAYGIEGITLAREMQERGLQHVHVHMANNGAAVALLAAAFDRRLSYSLSIHGSAEFFQVYLWRLQDKVEGATFVRCISHFCRSQVMAWTDPSAWVRFHIVHCAVDAAVFRKRVGGPDTTGPLRLLTVGRLDAIKGYPLLLEACRKLQDQGIEWELNMVGAGKLRPYLERSVRDLGLEAHVTLSGAVGQDDIHRHFERADVMVISSFMEGVPVVLMEAMAKEMAVVATRVGGIPELVDDGISGLLVAPGSVDALTAALAQMARNRASLASMGRAGRRKIVAEYTVDQLGHQMTELFQRYLGEPVTASEAEQDTIARPAGTGFPGLAETVGTAKHA